VSPKEHMESPPVGTAGRTATKQWMDANMVALLTIKKNCEDGISARIGNI